MNFHRVKADTPHTSNSACLICGICTAVQKKFQPGHSEILGHMLKI